jgi:hypothetical protein
MRYGAIAASRRPASTAARFFSDPGPGNFYLGLSSPSRTPLATHETKYGAPVAMLRTFSTSGAPNYAAIDSIIAGGRIPWTSWKNPSGISIADIATGAADAWIDGIAAGLAARAPWPVWWTFFHEPENDAPVSGVNAPTYRDAQRRMAQRIKAAGVTNSVFARSTTSSRSHSARPAAGTGGSGTRTGRAPRPPAGSSPRTRGTSTSRATRIRWSR